MIDKYNRTLNYFLKSISKNYLEFSEYITGYYTGVPEAYLNFLTIQKKPIDLERTLSRGKDFFTKFDQ